MITLARAHQLGVGRRWVVKQVQQKVSIPRRDCDEAFAVDHFIGLFQRGLYQKLVHRRADEVGSFPQPGFNGQWYAGRDPAPFNDIGHGDLRFLAESIPGNFPCVNGNVNRRRFFETNQKSGQFAS